MRVPRPALRYNGGVEVSCTELPTPVGSLRILAQAEGLRAVSFPGREQRDPQARVLALDELEGAGAAGAVLALTVQQLREYFEGSRRAFEVPLLPEGTAFQLRVWNELRTIPYGATWSYRDLARAVGDLKASRAVGAANGRNPIPILVPCHRVIGADGSLTGFGGGVPTKRWLLDHEARWAGTRLPGM